ncbi:MAG: hypothetical protein JWM56_156 [Candidatus Peribacteria bacterium]|nr:hypothetical protein [Candidatus Peribacteria bacterium]
MKENNPYNMQYSPKTHEWVTSMSDLIVGTLISAKCMDKQKYSMAKDIIEEEIYARFALNDFPA